MLEAFRHCKQAAENATAWVTFSSSPPPPEAESSDLPLQPLSSGWASDARHHRGRGPGGGRCRGDGGHVDGCGGAAGLVGGDAGWSPS